MIETREMTPTERRWLERGLRKIAAPRFADREGLWVLFLSLVSGIGIFRVLHDFVFHVFMPGRPRLGMALSVAAGLAFALGFPPWTYRLRGQIAEALKGHRAKLADDASNGVVEVHSADDVQSYFDTEQAPECRDLVVRFPEGEVRVDGAMCKREGISEPLSGRCRIDLLPRSGQVLEITARPA